MLVQRFSASNVMFIRQGMIKGTISAISTIRATINKPKP